jgi:hypothetical protein
VQASIFRHYRLLLILLIGLIIGLSFYLGYQEGRRKSVPAVALMCTPEVLSQLTVPTKVLASGAVAPEVAPLATGAFVGSKNSTKYYAPGCSAVKRIKPENYRWFKDARDAEIQGYTPGKC